MRCTDDTLDYLRDYGFNVVRFPRADLAPLQLFTTERGQLVWIGELATVFSPGEEVPLPPISDGAQGAQLSGRQTSQIDASLGLTVLGSIIGAMGGSNLGLEVGYQHARTVVFEFREVSERRVEPSAVDQYLSNAELNAHSRTVAQLLDADDVYLTTAVLQATSLTVSVTSSRSGHVGIEAPVVQELVGANIEVNPAAERTGALTYTGRIPLGFGFQALRLFYDEGRYHAFTGIPTAMSMRAGGAAEALEDGDIFMSSGRFARLSFT